MKLIKALAVRDSAVTDDVRRKAIARGSRRRKNNRENEAPERIAIVEIGWRAAEERLRLDLRALENESVKRLVTNEWWPREKEEVTYNPRVVAFSHDKGGPYGLDAPLSFLLKEAESLELTKALRSPHNPPRLGRPKGRRSGHEL